MHLIKPLSQLIKQRGFTLIEVMAALAVFVLSATGLYTINQQTLFSASHLENKTFAHWVALNTLNTIDAMGDLGSTGVETEKQMMAGSEWKTNVTIKATKISRVYQVTVSVQDESGRPYAEVVGFSTDKNPEEN